MIAPSTRTSLSALVLCPLLLGILGATCDGPSFPGGAPDVSDALATRGIAAHRGASETHPENTLAAFEEAVRLGAHQVEFDVRATRDQRLVVIHDERVDRTTDGRGRVSQLTLEQIRKLDAGSWKGKQFKGQRVPTLVEVLRMMPVNVWLNIHVKGDPWVAEEVALVVVEEDRLDQSILAVENEGAQLARDVHPGLLVCSLDRGISRGRYLAQAIESGAKFIQFHNRRGLPSREEVERAHQAGLLVNYCCEKDPTRLGGLFTLGIDFPLVDDVAGALRGAGQRGISPLRPVYRERD